MLEKWYVFLLVMAALSFTNCDNFFGGDTNNQNDTTDTGILDDKTFWGHWVRMDLEERWYINDAEVYKGSDNLEISAFDGESIAAGSYTLNKESENVLSVNEGAFFLFRNGGATGKILGKVKDRNAAKALSVGDLGDVSLII